MTKKKIVIFDDDDSTRRQWAENLRAIPGVTGDFEVRTVGENREFEEAQETLQARREDARAEREAPISRTFFDEADILIIDYDLFALKETGEEVAYLARCFSECGIIVGVNQFAKENFTFDLTLQGHRESFADLNLLAEQISNPGLWKTPWKGFRPWYWPLLPRAVEAFEQRTCEVADHLNEKILDFLEIPEQVQEIFPVGALEFISSRDATFRSFVEKSGQALRWKDVVSERAKPRIAAARLFKWLERLVLPGQNIVVDAAHLLERYPSLFKFKRKTPEHFIDWSNTHKLLSPEESVMDLDKIRPFRFTKSAWLSRTAWYWPLVSECEEIVEVKDPWARRQPLAFCEDTSRYVLPDDAEEFVAKVDSPFVRRFVSTRDSRYGPQLQFAL